MTADDVARDPRYLLHSVDPVGRGLVFRPTTQDAVRAAAFIDGRTDIWAGPPVTLPFADVRAADAEPGPYIFHMSFCGSTLLARLLDRPGKVLALKEPNGLVDLADWKTALAQGRGADADFQPMLRLAAAMLNRPWAEGEQILVKPSSWANNLIDDLGGKRTVFVTIARGRFVEAVLRGGTPRLAFTARLAAHLSPFVPGGPTRLQAAIDSTPDPVAKTARLALVAHDLELRLFERAIQPRSAIVDFGEVEDDPFGAASRAADALQLGLDAADIRANCDRWAGANAKADAAFSADQRRSENAQVQAVHGAVIDSALGWAEAALGPAGLQLD